MINNMAMVYNLCMDGIKLARSGNIVSSLQYFEEAYNKNPESVYVNYCLGLYLLAKKEYKQSYFYLNNALKNSNRQIFCKSLILLALTKLEHEQQNSTCALIYIKYAINLKINMDHVYYTRGLIYYDRGEYDLSIKDLKQVLLLNPNYPDVLMNIGNCCVGLGKYKKAIKYLSESIEKYPTISLIYYNRANVYCILKQFNLAIDDYSIAIKLDSLDSSIYFNRGNTYFELKLYDQAITDYMNAITYSYDKNNSRFYEMVACTHFVKKDLKCAKEYILHAIKLEKNVTYSLYFNAASIFYDLKEYSESLDYIKKSLELKKDFSKSLKLLENLNIILIQ